MSNTNFGDASVLFEIARQMKSADTERLDWIRSMLQRVVDGDHAGDTELFAKTWLTLKRPTARQHADLLEIQNTSYDRPFTNEGRDKIETLNRSWGPDSVEVVRVTGHIMFGMEKHESQGNKVLVEAHRRYGLVLCPPWVSIALCVDSSNGADQQQYKHDQIHVCMQNLNPDKSNPEVMNIIYGKNWWAQDTYSTSQQLDFFPTYLMAKPWEDMSEFKI